MPKTIRIIVVQGHRNTSGGNPEEASRTPAIANAIVTALKSVGHDAFCLQHNDGKPDDWFAGTLDAVARRVVWHYTQQPIDLMLDIHLESNPANTPGIFAIVPDGDGLRTLTHFDGSDSLASNDRDRAFAEAISRQIARTTGLTLRQSNVISPGVMSERQTHAGADLGWRLAMFGYTAPVRERMSRLVLECGNIVADRQFIDSPGFPKRVAQGVVAGIASVLGNELPVEPEPLKFPPFGTIGVLRDVQQVNVTAHKIRARIYAETSQPIAMELARGSNFPAGGWIIGESIEDNPVWWMLGESSAKDTRWRIWSGGTDMQGLDILKLPAAPSSSRA